MWAKGLHWFLFGSDGQSKFLLCNMGNCHTLETLVILMTYQTVGSSKTMYGHNNLAQGCHQSLCHLVLSQCGSPTNFVHVHCTSEACSPEWQRGGGFIGTVSMCEGCACTMHVGPVQSCCVHACLLLVWRGLRVMRRRVWDTREVCQTPMAHHPLQRNTQWRPCQPTALSDAADLASWLPLPSKMDKRAHPPHDLSASAFLWFLPRVSCSLPSPIAHTSWSQPTLLSPRLLFTQFWMKLPEGTWDLSSCCGSGKKSKQAHRDTEQVVW